MDERTIEEAAEIIAKGKHVIAFSGAGISAESGIPTFRDPGGLWDKFDPGEIGTTPGILQFAMRHPERIRDFLRETVKTFKKADPNPGHLGLVELEKMGILHSVVTRNIDDLHSIAGNTKVYEVHGNLYRFRCMNCGATEKQNRDDVLERVNEILDHEPFNPADLLKAMPVCSCGGLMRIDVVMFGEAVQEMPESYGEARSSDVVIVLGTSGVVWPAAGVPYEAKQSGAKVININPTVDAFQDITDVHIQAASGETMPQIIDLVKELR